MAGVLGGVRDFLKSRNVKLVVLIEASPRDLTQNQPLNYVHLSKYSDYSQNIQIIPKILCRLTLWRFVNCWI
jgi:hypothetical protein